MRPGIAAAVLLASPIVSAQFSGTDALLKRARLVSLAYSRTLPNFICTQTIRRTMRWKDSDIWASLDTLTVQVTYAQQKETYKLLQRNGHSTSQSYESVAGAISAGEFGSTLRWIFDPSSQTEFRWKGASGSPRRAVFEYRVSPENSRYKLVSGISEIVAGYHGAVEIDPETAHVLHVAMIADLPTNFPIRKSGAAVDYGAVRLDGADYLLPIHAQVDAADVPHGEMGPQPHITDYRNFIDFRAYRKFTVDSRLVNQ
jgi:hypothetical protein